MKPHRMSNGYMNLLVSVNGKTVNPLAHRVTAMCFLPNPKGLPQVNHKNCIRDDNRVENLEWCSASYNRRYREKYGMSSAEVLGHHLFAINLKTSELLCFESRHEASRELKINRGNIGSVLKGRYKQAGGYWFTENKNAIAKKKLNEIKAGMIFLGGVIAVNLNTFEVLRFKSQSEAAQQLEASVGAINGVLKGRRNTHHGFWFTYANENAVEATRAKFGDKVANKVLELLKKK